MECNICTATIPRWSSPRGEDKVKAVGLLPGAAVQKFVLIECSGFPDTLVPQFLRPRFRALLRLLKEVEGLDLVALHGQEVRPTVPDDVEPVPRLGRGWSVSLCGMMLVAATLAAEGAWLTVHVVTEDLVRLLP